MLIAVMQTQPYPFQYIAGWNSPTIDKDSMKLLKLYDIVCFQETWILENQFDTMYLSGFIAYIIPARKLYPVCYPFICLTLLVNRKWNLKAVQINFNYNPSFLIARFIITNKIA